MTGWLKANANYSTSQCSRLRGNQLVDSIDILLEQAEQLSFNDARTCLRRW